MLNSLTQVRSLAPFMMEAFTAQRIAPYMSQWSLITSGRAHLSLTTHNWKEEKKKPELFIDQVLRDFDGRGVQSKGSEIKSENAFRLFKLEEKLMIDEARLKREMIKLQRAIHPDKYINAGLETYQKTEHLSSLVNESYEILRHPYKRAKYLLSLRWNKSQDDIESRLDRLQLDPDFLSNMMDLRELINATNDMHQMLKMSSQIESDLDQLTLAVDRSLKSGEYEATLKDLGKLKFVANCHVALKDKLGNVGNF